KDWVSRGRLSSFPAESDRLADRSGRYQRTRARRESAASTFPKSPRFGDLKKLQPHRTMHLRGFDGRGAAAALHSATDGGFTVSGYFVTASDFAVLML